MTSARAKEVLYDSETMLRLVDNELDELRERDGAATVATTDALPNSTDFGTRLSSTQLSGTRLSDAQLSDARLSVLQCASAEISRVMHTLRNSRQTLHGVALEHLHTSTAKIQAVSSAAETAATNILDSVDRAQLLVDQLEQLSGESEDDEAATIRGQLRDELFGMMGALQFQDITAQQLGHVSDMLTDVEQRLLGVSALLGGAPGAAEGAATLARRTPGDDAAYAPSASTRNAGERQAAADALVRLKQSP